MAISGVTADADIRWGRRWTDRPRTGERRAPDPVAAPPVGLVVVHEPVMERRPAFGQPLTSAFATQLLAEVMHEPETRFARQARVDEAEARYQAGVSDRPGAARGALLRREA
ncbi:hypothetical protein [Phreatobacter stygius]|uniref:Uncharacterized protein n=1 Tax=Phreatobacter stygius TaxID=1940610 RepID=A0A4D7AUQ2_9HYPH|nr:hypothetical protein [Phreatobacter stygius]QCI64619.1 hypothetical protein E8M01_10505 [Phreatobacter stygius]